MAEYTIRTRLSREQVHARLLSLTDTMVTSASAASRTLLVRLGNATLKVVHDSFNVKTRGRADQSGLRWQKTARKKVWPHGILLERGILRSSLTPSKDETVQGYTLYQIFRLSQGEVKVGTARPFAFLHHRGIPGKLAQRRLWQSPDKWPSKWTEQLLRTAVRGIGVLVREQLR